MKEYEVQGLYAGSWESVFTAPTKAEALSVLRDYRVNEPNTYFRLAVNTISTKGWELRSKVLN